MSLLAHHSRRRLCTKTILARYLTQPKTARDGRIPSLEVDMDSFEAAGIQPPVVASLRAAFPNVQKPTAMQRKLIRAMTNNRDVLLQDDTGTGKSFAAILALLSKFSARKASSVVDENNDGIGKAPRGLLIVPHRDLAYQYLHWIHHMTLPNGDTPSSLAEYAQVLVRNANKSTMRSLPVRMQEAIRSSSSDQDLLIHKPPHILIATPNAVLELMEHQTWFQLATPSTVVVDEVDALLRVPSSKLPKERRRTLPPSGNKQSMDRRSRSNMDESLEHAHTAPAYRPQLVMISATLRNRLQSALFNTFGWVQRGEAVKLIRQRSSAVPSHRLGRSAMHHVLVVSKTGDIKNIIGALPSQPDVSGDATLENDVDNAEDAVFYDSDDDPELVDEADKELLHAPLAFDPAALEAVAGVFALDVPRAALFVLPATAAVRKIVFELRQLGVNAQPLDLVENEASRTHVLSRMDEDVSDENPVLIVATLATVRGIDLPDLSHVFMLGVPEGRSGDAYLHVAGRVGRFGRQGKVVTILEERQEKRTGNKVVVTDEPRKMAILLSRIGVQASRLEHFD
ncbi:P-loop containing nucleoside triphosphate hydrolase protein [Boletus reticuloceps]|uniref:RNA helicase n=1 Tax=Boletus reticuloceps TaxID=495285 RepID=A0A8I2YX48_9AGAM|nr:P-loop containing nucleoside triphosphate hydrolase protein [Boletus reticuloceps]